MDKEFAKKCCHKMYKFKVRKIVDSQIDTFFEIENSSFSLPKHPYKVGDDVILNENKYLHGTGRNEDSIKFVSENGVLSKESTGNFGRHAVKYVAGFWRVEKEISLREYIINYSGMDVAYERSGELVPYTKLDEFVERMRTVDHWKWNAESPMEIRFMPSLARDINQYGVILNIESEEAKRLIKYDVNTDNFDEKFKSNFGIGNLKGNKRDGVNNFIKRASYVIFGMNKVFIEGVVVGRIVEKDSNKLKELKEMFPSCYICNLDGKVIVE